MIIKLTSRKTAEAVTYAVLIFILFLFLLPYIFMALSAFKTRLEVFAYPPVWIFKPTLENLKTVIFGHNLIFYLKNTLIICLANTALTLLISVPAAYSFARFRFKFKETAFILFLILQLVPSISVIIGFYQIAQILHIYDTCIVLIITYLLWNVPFATWMLRGFFEGIPPEVEEQALIDGYSRLGALARVTLPLAAPGLGAVVMLLFILSWNEFTLPYFLTSYNARPLSTTVMFYTTHTEVMWGEIFALGFIATIPVIFLALLVRKSYVKALTFGAVKG